MPSSFLPGVRRRGCPFDFGPLSSGPPCVPRATLPGTVPGRLPVLPFILFSRLCPGRPVTLLTWCPRLLARPAFQSAFSFHGMPWPVSGGGPRIPPHFLSPPLPSLAYFCGPPFLLPIPSLACFAPAIRRRISSRPPLPPPRFLPARLPPLLPPRLSVGILLLGPPIFYPILLAFLLMLLFALRPCPLCLGLRRFQRPSEPPLVSSCFRAGV